MDPDIWGPYGWHILHRMAYQINDVTKAQRFYVSLQYILPCRKCQKNFKQHIQALPIPSHVSSFGRWVYDLHNRVNTSKSHPSTRPPPSYNIVHKLYTAPSSPLSRHSETEWIFIDAVVHVRPGGHRASDKYLENLKVFLEQWCATSGVQMPKNLASKRLLKSWVAQNFKSGMRHNEACGSSTCTIP